MASTPDKPKKKRRQSSTPKQGQLTGFPRRIKDAVAELHNGIQKWEILKNKAFNVLSDIANLKIASRDSDIHSCYPNGLESLCHDFRKLYDKMEQLSQRMDIISQQFDKIANLTSVSSSEVFFLSWPVTKFSETAKELSEMYNQEIKAKQAIVESVAHIDLLPGGEIRDPESSRDVLMTYVACWLHEPYIDEDNRSLLLEELLLETGHHQ